MTLIEVLVALAIAAVVFAAVFMLFRTTATTAVHQREREKTVYAPAELLAAIQSDIAALVPDGLDENCELKLEGKSQGGAGPLSEISFCRWQPRGGGAGEALQTAVEKVMWHVADPGGRDARIERTASAVTGPTVSQVATNRYLPGIASFRLQLHDGRDWLAVWPPPDAAENKDVRPVSLRVQIAMQGDSAPTNWMTEFIVPAGLTATSRIQRLTAPPPPRADPAPHVPRTSNHWRSPLRKVPIVGNVLCAQFQ